MGALRADDLGARAVTGIFLVCALTVTALLIRREFWQPPVPTAFTPDKNWRTYAAAGQRIGPPDAKVVMIEFADFQCPACRALHSQVGLLRERYPADFALVYRHWPMPNHRHARVAAMASECAGVQTRFEQMYEALFVNADSIGITPWNAFASSAGVPDVPAFDKCLRDSSTALIVDRDSRTAVRTGGRGTPTVFINGVRFTGVPEPATLDSLVRVALRTAVTAR